LSKGLKREEVEQEILLSKGLIIRKKEIKMQPNDKGFSNFVEDFKNLMVRDGKKIRRVFKYCRTVLKNIMVRRVCK
jgi:hypothetical protein